VSVSYALTDGNELAVDYAATSDAPTPVNLSQHTYFNLAGHDAGGMLDHELQILAGRFTPVDETLIPTGTLQPVANSPFDFRTPHVIGARIEASDPQLQIAGGYDHNFVLDRDGDGLQVVARVHDPRSGRTLEVRTTEPGVQFYTGNMLDGSQLGKGGHPYGRRAGFCLETQHFPDSPNHPAFPSTILRPGQPYRSETVFAFGVA
jgi:aldose 1-epimerase